jgi:gliding motility-associated-like protein
VDANGCIATDDVTVFVEASDDYTIFIPNTFTPNGDLSNDYFLPLGFNIDRILSLRIYDRWGTLLYEANNITPGDYQVGWDGTYQNQPVNTDVYAYVVEFLIANGSVVMKGGNVTLLR